MSKRSEIITPVEFAEVIPAQTLDGINYERRMTFGKLIAHTSVAAALPQDYASQEDLQRAQPNQLQSGLYILWDDPRYNNAELRIKNTIFTSQEFPLIARSPNDLARQSKAATRNARRGDSDRDETDHAAHRSAGHALEEKLKATDEFLRRSQNRRETLASLAYDLGGTWPHYKGRNLEARREEVDQAIHETAEVAAVNQADWDNRIVQGIHRAIKLHLYRPNDNPAHRRLRWLGYMKMVDRHTAAKMQIATTARKFTATEFQKYEPYLKDVLF